jgi:gliding motility-associated-like protein
MAGKLSCNIKLLIFSLLLVSGISGPLFSQTKISGIINKYGRVTGIGTDYVIVDDATQFAQFLPGDTVLLIEMKGVRIYTSELPLSYGTPEFSYGPSGKHEFLTILSVDGGTKKITFRNNIIYYNNVNPANNFNVEGDVQIIKVPSYNFAQVDGTLTCQPWDSVSKTGGVLSAIIGRTLTLNANIDVSNKGFKGAAPAQGLGLCSITDPKLDRLAFPATTDSAGFKGESPVSRGSLIPISYPKIYPKYAKGKGANLTGGGGGNGKFSGGGGGANYGAGGKGGRELSACSNPIDGGLGGKSVTSSPFLDAGIFLGGGGGGSTYQTGGLATAGGNGGGIVILVGDTIKGNVKSILADGGSVTTSASGNAGASGGGGGGSIALYLQSYSTTALTLSAKGGKGGDNLGQLFGEGGGGGGGFINTSSATPANVLKTLTGGSVGTRAIGPTGTSGTAGIARQNFVPVLNGFLFNSIRSSVTGDQTDSICSNVIPKPITGTTPVGGSGSYTYLWQKSYSLTGPPINIPGSNVKDYTPTVTESDTVWFRRVVTDNITVPVLSDTSKWVEIRVQTAIEGNIVGKDTTLCYNQIPLTLVPLNSGPTKGNGKYQYQWIQNNTNTSWTSSPNATGVATASAYDPPALTETTYYKRIVTSGRCIDYSTTVSITVLPLITGNVMARPDSVICEGTLFNTLNASAAGGGAGTYKYLWQDSITSGTWTAAPVVRDGANYSVDTSAFTVREHRYFRRIVFSGPDSVCISKSLPIHMTRYHYIENNTISRDTTICSGSIPPALTGSTPTKGSGIYTYIWQDSPNNATWTARGTSISPFAPPALTDTTWYRRIVNSSKCADTSVVLVINVHKPIANNISSLLSGPGPDTTICSGAKPHKIEGSFPTGGTNLPGDYAYLWYYSTDNFASSNIAVAAGGTLADYQPGSLTETTWFRRKVISGKCETYSNAIRVIVLPPVTNNVISSTQAKICFGTVPLTITGTALTGGAGGTPTWLWQQSADGVTWNTAVGTTSNQQNYSPLTLTAPVKYRRIILSGPSDCCQDTSNILDIGIHPLPTGTLTTVADTTICNGSSVLLKVQLTGASPWNVIYTENAIQVSASNIAVTNYVISRIPDGSAASSSTFNYSLYSVTDNNGCTATAMTGSRKATVYRVPVAFAGDPEDNCGPEYKLEAVPTDGTGKWTWEAAAPVLAPYPVAYNDKVKIDEATITGASSSYKFYWEEKNWQCVSKDSVTITFYNPIDIISAGNDTTLYSFDYLMQVSATPLKPYETGTWFVLEGTGAFDSEYVNATTVRNISPGVNKYKWKVKNGACELTAEILVKVVNLQIPRGFSPNGDGLNDTYKINGLDRRKKPDSSLYQIAELKILNGAGRTVFETSQTTGNKWKEWDGKNSKGIDLPEGTYYYLLKIISVEVPGQVFKESGFIILKRY